MISATSSGPVDSIYGFTSKERTDTNVPLFLSFYNSFLSQYLHPTTVGQSPANVHTTIQRICANNTHLGLHPNMTDNEFFARYVRARAAVFEKTLEMATKKRRCSRCKQTFTLLTSSGRKQCYYHPGGRYDGAFNWACCNGTIPCQRTDHFDGDPADDGVNAMYSLLHLALLPVYKIPAESVCVEQINPMYVVPDRLMVLDDAKSVASQNSMVYIRIK